MNIGRVGVFHYASECNGDPVKTFEDALAASESSDRFGESLLVLPEAFNLRLGYWASGHNIGCGIRDRLVEISLRYKIAIVAGLLHDHGGYRPYNCAYLIDGGEPQLLSRKAMSDSSGNYDNCDLPFDELDIVITRRGVRIAALVCMDADKVPAFGADHARRHEDVRQRLAVNAPRVLCVPSCFTRSTEEVVKAWNGITVALANRGKSFPSAIRLEDGEIQTCSKDEDRIYFVDLTGAKALR
jgi:predicted amidohydrolase